MAVRWETMHRCQKCLHKSTITHIWAQEWGKDSDGTQDYKLDCPYCGDVTYSKWNGLAERKKP